MRPLLTSLITVRHPEGDAQRRGQNIILLAAGLNVLTILLTAYATVAGSLSPQIIIPAITGFVVQTAVIIAARNGHVDLAGGIMVGMAIMGIVGSAILNADQFITPIFLPIPLLIGAAVQRPTSIVITLFGVLAGMAVIASALPPPENVPLRNALFVVIGLLSFFITLTGVLIGIGNERLRRRLREEVQRADQTLQALQTLNEELDLRVQMQTETLQQILHELEERSAEQERLLQEIAGQRDIIRELSLPILPVGDDVLVAPLIGALDGERLRQLQTQAFQRVERTHARMLILDVTGVPLIDTHVAHGLTGLIQGLRLLGADVVIVGVRPEVAQTIVGLGIQLQKVSVFSDLGSALQHATLRSVEHKTIA
jgi:rsbT co-antagonist protein RsbR